jgi:hypothetical protein
VDSRMSLAGFLGRSCDGGLGSGVVGLRAVAFEEFVEVVGGQVSDAQFGELGPPGAGLEQHWQAIQERCAVRSFRLSIGVARLGLAGSCAGRINRLSRVENDCTVDHWNSPSLECPDPHQNVVA